MNIHYLQHESFETPARITEWARREGHILHGIHLYRGDAVPSPDEVAGLIIMGGPMSVHDESRYPWMKEEKQLASALFQAGKPVFGVCLGAQIIAQALGATVEPMGYREIGWWPVKDGNSNDFTAFHWHGECFSLPAGADPLFSTKAWREQGFRYGENCVALQFHLEMDRAGVLSLIDNCRNELEDSLGSNHNWVQSEKEIKLFAEKMDYERLMQILSELLNPLFS